jgi:hypothetical protein
MLHSYTSHENIRDISAGVTFKENESSVKFSALELSVYRKAPRQTSKYIIKSWLVSYFVSIFVLSVCLIVFLSRLISYISAFLKTVI